MDTFSAYAKGMASRGQPFKVFDWDRAARRIKETGCAIARAGLESDWEWTGGDIYKDGAPVPEKMTYVYLASTWATPELELDYETEDCWRWQGDTPNWDAETYWPESALNILREE